MRAAALTASANGRFEILEEHGSNGTTQGVFLLDTETGCVWNNSPLPSLPSTKPNGSNLASYLLEGGNASFSILAFDTAKFEPPIMPNGEADVSKEDFSSAIHEVRREERLCDQARVEALQAAAR